MNIGRQQRESNNNNKLEQMKQVKEETKRTEFQGEDSASYSITIGDIEVWCNSFSVIISPSENVRDCSVPFTIALNHEHFMKITDFVIKNTDESSRIKCTQ
jgi:hypothetical protein